MLVEAIKHLVRILSAVYARSQVADRFSDEQTGLLEGDGYGPASVSPPRQQKRPSFVWRVFALLRRLSSRLNFLVSRRPWRLFEFCDLWLYAPEFS